MIYEMRSYEVVPGRLADLNARFARHTLGFFEKHGVQNGALPSPTISRPVR
jgi:hypothetical protein